MNIANLPLPGGARDLLALLRCFALGLHQRRRRHADRHPVLHHDARHDADRRRHLAPCWCAARSPTPCRLIKTLGSGTIGGRSRGSSSWPALFLLVGHLVLTYTRFGRYVYMVGGNREAAEYSGVNVKLIIASVMVISAVCSGIAGMLGVAYFGSAQQNEFDDFLLDAIAAVVVGGTSLFGGRGGIANTIIGLFVLGVLNNGLDHIDIDSFLKILIRGLILLLA